MKNTKEVQAILTAICCINQTSEHKDDDIYIYKNYDWDDYGRKMFNCCGYEIPDSLLDFFDFEAYGESFKYDGIEEYSEGLIEIRR